MILRKKPLTEASSAASRRLISSSCSTSASAADSPDLPCLIKNWLSVGVHVSARASEANSDTAIVNYQAHGGCEPAQGHQVEALSHQFQGYECDRNRDRNYQSRHDRGSPVAEKNYQNDRGENETDQDGISNARDGLMDDQRLVI